MKRLLFVLTAIIFVSVTILPAQLLDGLHAIGGFKYSTQAWEDDFAGDLKYLLGLEGGVGIEREFFGYPFVVRALLVQRGTKWEWSESGVFYSEEDKSKIKMTYLTIPVLMKYPFCDGYFLGGFETGFLLSAKDKWEWKQSFHSGNETITDKEKDTEDVKHDYKSLDFGITLGGGMPIPWEYAALTVEVMYYLGLVNIWDGDGDCNDKNRSLNLAVIYKF